MSVIITVLFKPCTTLQYCIASSLQSGLIMHCTCRPVSPATVLNVAKAKLFELSNGPSPPTFDGPRLKLIWLDGPLASLPHMEAWPKSLSRNADMETQYLNPPLIKAYPLSYHHRGLMKHFREHRRVFQELSNCWAIHKLILPEKKLVGFWKFLFRKKQFFQKYVKYSYSHSSLKNTKRPEK